MDAAQMRRDAISDVEKRYISGFISYNHAISLMSNIQRTTYIDATDLTFFDLESKKVVAKGNSGVLAIRKE